MVTASPSPSVDPVRERITEMTGQKYLDQHDAGLLGAALTAVLDECQEQETYTAECAEDAGYRDPAAYAADHTVVSSVRLRAAIAAGLGVTP